MAKEINDDADVNSEKDNFDDKKKDKVVTMKKEKKTL